MPKLRRRPGAEVIAILSKYGFVKVRQRGSHITMRKVSDAGQISVTVSASKQVPVGTLRAIIRKSGIPRGEFE